jgi:hypothetical protein
MLTTLQKGYLGRWVSGSGRVAPKSMFSFEDDPNVTIPLCFNFSKIPFIQCLFLFTLFNHGINNRFNETLKLRSRLKLPVSLSNLVVLGV